MNAYRSTQRRIMIEQSQTVKRDEAFYENIISKSIQRSKNLLNPFIVPQLKFKIDKNIKGKEFLSFSIMDLSSKREKNLSARNLRIKQRRSIYEKNDQHIKNPKTKKENQIVCQFCAKKTTIQTLDKHLNSCSQAIYCKGCQQYILKASKQYHQMNCFQKKKKQIQMSIHQNVSQQQLKLRQLRNVSYENDEKEKPMYKICIICCSQFIKNEKIIQTQCNHRFHYNCMKMWIQVKNRCFTCNKVMFQQ